MYLKYCIFQALLTSLSQDLGETKLNNKNVTYNNTLVLKHKDVFTIGDRSFRWEYPEESQHIAAASISTTSSKKTPSKKSDKTPLTPKTNGNNNSSASGSSVANKGGYGGIGMSPKAKMAAASAANMSPKKSKKNRELTHYFLKFLFDFSF